MNWTVPTAFALFLVGATIGLGQLWLRLWPPDTFIKIMITVGVLFVVVIAWNLVARERRDNAKTRDRSRLG
jgi:hypothetical protein